MTASTAINPSTGLSNAQVLASSTAAAQAAAKTIGGTYTDNSSGSGGFKPGPTTPSFSAPATINSANTSPSSQVILPPPPMPSSAGTNAMTQIAGTAAAATATSPATTPTTTETDAQTAFQAYLKSIQQPPDTAKIYQKDLNNSNVAVDQQAVNTYQSQLNAITAKAQADKLSLVGQGNGVPNPIIGGQQAEIDREAAIQALPISAQLAAAQSNLTLAQDNVDTLFKLQAADAQNKVTYQNSLITAVYNFATSEQKTQLDALTTANNQKFQTQTNNLNYAQSLATAAISNGQSGIAAQLMKLDPTDPNYAANIATLAGGIQVKSASVPLADQKTYALSSLQQSVVSNNGGQPLSDGKTYVIDKNGYISTDALKQIIAAAPSENLTAADVLTELRPYIYAPKGVVDPGYELNKAEAALVNAAS